MSKKRLSLFLFFLLIVMTFSLIIPACNTKEKTAIIILPGIMGSGLYDKDTGEPLWDPLKLDLELTDFVNHSGKLNLTNISELLEEGIPLLTDVLKQTENSIFHKMAVDDDGAPINDTVLPVDANFSNPERLRYGVLNTNRAMYDEMQNRYGKHATVSVFNYDWRLDNRLNAEKLENYINDNGYKKIILLAHSMGGNLASCYFARCEENREKCAAYISYDSPYLGSLMALSILEDAPSIADSIVNMVADIGADIGIVASFLQGITERSNFSGALETLGTVIEEDFLPMLNIASIIQLLPSYDYLQSNNYRLEWEYENFTKQKSFIVINGEFFAPDREGLLDFYASRPWAIKEDGTLRQPVKELDEYWESMMVTQSDGTKVHSTKLVNTLYISGIGYSTQNTASYQALLTPENEIDFSTLVYDPSRNESTDLGDGTVTIASATVGSLASANNVKIITNAEHFDVAIPFKAFTADVSYEFLDSIIF